MEKIKRPRGTMDIVPPESTVWQYIEGKAREVSRRFGFGEIRTPAFEEIGLFKRGVGEVTDVVQKEMYTFTDKEDRTFALRPEGTASVVRAMLEGGHQSDPLPLRYFYLINCFRYEKPQAGRSREFFQYGVEMFGAPSPAADYNIISLADTFIRELGITGVELHINSIGCPECRGEYKKALTEYLHGHEDKLCENCRDRLERSPLRVLDCKNPECAEIAEGAPKTIDHLCPACREHMDKLESLLDAAGIAYVIDPHIVRGLDYYTRTVFEFIVPGIGAQSTVCGGGRYDGLVEQLGGAPMAGIGFAMGITRLILAMEQCGAPVPAAEGPSLYVAPMGDDAAAFAASLVGKLRREGVAADFDVMGRSLKSQMKYADKIGAKYVLMLGDNEIASGKAELKNMQTGEQTALPLDGIAGFILNK